MNSPSLKVLLASASGAHQHHTGRELKNLGALHEIWLGDQCANSSLKSYYRRCWPYHLVIKPLLHSRNIGLRDSLIPRFLPIWDQWVRRQNVESPPNAVMSIMGFATGPFDFAEKHGALKIVDASSSHPTSFYGFWQRECDIWNPGSKVSLPRSVYARCNRELERADLIICASNFVRDSMLYNGIPSTKLAVSPYGTDLKVFKERNAPPAEIQFVTVGTLTVRKGHQYLFEAMRLVRKHSPDAQLVVVGGVHNDFVKLMKRWQGEFIHYPIVTHERLSQILAQSTAFVFPSCEEGFARVISESMACGLPIVATHESGATTAVRDGVEGLIIPGRNPSALAEAMIRLIEDPALGASLGRAAAVWARANGSWEAYGKSLLSIIGNRLAARR